MIQEESKITIEKSHELKESMVGISAGNEAHILSILRDKLYSDKILAVVREYVTNAYDAHIENNIPDRPVEITIPNQFNPMFIVRDYGKGLDEQMIRETYVMYGASTKRTTNRVNGMYGIGSKAAFCYVDSFNITSIYNGVKYEYCCYIDESKCGKIALLNESGTIEESGIEIRIPVKEKDFSEFHNKVKNTFCYMNPLPLVNGKELEKIEVKYEKDLGGGNKVFFNTYHYNSDTKIIMGGIPYKVDYRTIYNADYWEFKTQYNKEDKLNDKRPNIIVPIGAVDISASRENLEYTEKTNTYLKKLFSSIPDITDEDIVNKITKSKTLKKAKQSYHKWMQYLTNQKVIYNNEVIEPEIIKDYLYKDHNTGFSQEYNCNIYERYNYNNYNKLGTIGIKEEEILFIEVDITHQWKSKINRWLEEDSNRYNLNTYYIQWPSEETKKLFFNKYKLEEYEWMKLSELDIPKLERSPRKKSTSTAHLGQIFTYDFSMNADELYPKSSLWTKVTQEINNNRQKYYVILDKFKITNFTKLVNKYETLHKYFSLIKEEVNPNIQYSDIIGVKTKYKDKIDPKWQNIEEIAHKVLDKYKTYYAEVATIKNNNIKLEDFELPEEQIQNKKSQVIQLIKYTDQYKENVEKVKKIFGNNWDNYRNKILMEYTDNTHSEKVEKINKLIDNYYKTYPLLKRDRYYGHFDINEKDKILYINLMDNYYKEQEKKENE